MEPDTQFVNDLRRRLRAEAQRKPKSGRIAGLSIAAITIITAFASLFLLLNVANERPTEITKGDPGEPTDVTSPAELGPPMQIEATEQIIELFSVNYGTADSEIGEPVKRMGGSDLTPMSFFVKDDVFYILDNAEKKVVVTDGTKHLLTIQLDEDAWLKDIFVDDEGAIYVLEEGQAVSKYDIDGKLLDKFVIQPDNFITTSLSVNSDGEILVHESGSRTLKLSTNETVPYVRHFVNTIVKADRVSETEGRLTLTEASLETVIDIPFEHSFGSLAIHDVNSSQLIYEKGEVLQHEDFSLSFVSHLIVADKTNGNFLGAVRIPLDLWSYYTEHFIRLENNEIFFMSPETAGVHFYQLRLGAEEVEIPEPGPTKHHENPFEKVPSVENEAVMPYLTEDFFNQLKEGHIPGADIRIGSSLSDMKNKLGEPEQSGELEGGHWHQYGTYLYIQSALQDTIIGIIMNIKEDGVTGEDFAKA